MFCRLLLIATAAFLFIGYPVRGDEEEYLEVTEVRIAGYDAIKTGLGDAVFTAKLSAGDTHRGTLREVTIDAFKQRYTLNNEMLQKLAGFPLASLKITHSAGYERTGGPGVYFRFYRDYLDAEGRQHKDKVLVSVNKGRGLTVHDPESEVIPRQSTGAGAWSKPVQGLEARITLVEKVKINGTRSLVPYLELRNVSDSASPFKVRCSQEHVKFELIGADGKVVRDGLTLPRSGPHPDPGTVVLPIDSSMRIGMHCTNWGVPKDAPAMVATDSGAWVLQSQENGKVFLRATIKGARLDSDPDRTWHGTIATPLVKVEWSK